MEKFGLLFWICLLSVQHLILEITAQYQLPAQIQHLEKVTDYQMPNGERYSCETLCYPQLDCNHFLCLTNPPSPICKYCVHGNVAMNQAPTPQYIQAYLAKLYAERQNAISIAIQQQRDLFRAKLREYLANQIKEHRISNEVRNKIEESVKEPPAPSIKEVPLVPVSVPLPQQPVKQTEVPVVCPLVEAQKKKMLIPTAQLIAPVVTTTAQTTSPQINLNDSGNKETTTSTERTTETTTIASTTSPPEVVRQVDIPTATPTLCEILAERERERIRVEESFTEASEPTPFVPPYNITETTDLPIVIHAMDVTEPSTPAVEVPRIENDQNNQCATGSMCFVSIVPTVVSYPGYKIVYGPNSNASCSMDSNATHIPCENKDKIVQFIDQALKSGRLIQHESGISGEKGIIAPNGGNLQLSAGLKQSTNNDQIENIRNAIAANGGIISAVHNLGSSQGIDRSNEANGEVGSMGTGFYRNVDRTSRPSSGSVAFHGQSATYNSPPLYSTQHLRPTQLTYSNGNSGSTAAQFKLQQIQQQQYDQQLQQALQQRQLLLQQQRQNLQQMLQQQKTAQAIQSAQAAKALQAGHGTYYQATGPYYQQGSYIVNAPMSNDRPFFQQDVANGNSEAQSNSLLNLKLQAKLQPNQLITNGLKSILPTQAFGLNNLFRRNNNNKNPLRRTDFFDGGDGWFNKK